MKKIYFIALIALFFILELVLWINQTVGFYAYVVLVGVILIALERDKSKEFDFTEKLLIFLTIIPIARISEFFIEFGFFWETFIFYFVISFLVIFYTKKFRINHGYTKKKLWFLPLSIVIGILMGYAGNYLFELEKYPELLVLIPLIVFSEEILFRGMIQNFAGEYGSSFSIIITSLLVAIFSFMSLGYQFAIFLFMCNLIIGLIYDETGNIFLTIPISLILNLLLFII
jgi:membrane protease YdiL (CAAX protease family)